MYLAEVEHRPTELLTFGIGHDLIMYRIIIGIEVHLRMADDSLLEMFVQSEAEIILQSTLRHEVGIAHICIVEVVECRHTETLLDISPHGEKGALEGIDIHKKSGSEFRKRTT